ncbi:hypothetical protein [Streptomyces sp. H27-C3]|uniref:hypothetical protein n=1 Tax=Streptomyces sp. H27-C3 TaxID=3046305 RepID=UPI0024B96D7E|nr:hypothetical protein [Streptomyces sp. H27-C3]MDJ0463094.1 hypothetical protein [Streptomyces sp. H27-C3]
MPQPLDEQVFSFVQINVPGVSPIIQKLDGPVSYGYVREEYQGIQFTYGFREGSMSVSAGSGSFPHELYVYYVSDPRDGPGTIDYDGRRMVTAPLDRI